MDSRGPPSGAHADPASQAHLGARPEGRLTPRPASPTLILFVYATLVLIWGTTWLAIKIGLEYLPPFFSLGVRFIVAGGLLLAFMRLRGERIPVELRHQPFFAGIGTLQFGISYGVVYWGEQYISSGLTAVFFALLPLFTSIVAHLALKAEHLGRNRLIGILIGLAGIVLINSSDLEQMHPKAPLAGVLMLLGPITTAIATVYSKKRLIEFTPLTLAGMPMIYGGLIHFGLWVLFEGGRTYDWGWPGLAALAYLTIPGSVITFGGYYWLLARMEVSRANLIAYLTPIVALVVGYVWGGESLTLLMIAGSALVMIGVAIAGRRTRLS